MTIRTVQFLGTAFSPTGNVNVILDFNNSRVFSGDISASTVPLSQRPDTSDRGVLFTFPLDTSVTGSVPLVLQVSGGTIGFFSLHGNYTGYKQTETETILPVDYYSDLNVNTVDDDGRTNIKIDGVPQDRGSNAEPTPLTEGAVDFNLDAPGDWCWIVGEDSTFTCNFRIEKTVEEIPSDAPA